MAAIKWVGPPVTQGLWGVVLRMSAKRKLTGVAHLGFLLQVFANEAKI